PCPRTPGPCKSSPVAALRQRCNWRERFLSGYWRPRYAYIAITPDTARPAHGAAIVGVVRDDRAGAYVIDEDGYSSGKFALLGQAPFQMLGLAYENAFHCQG